MRLAMDAMRNWALRTGLDGFRFDLATVMGRTDEGFSNDAPLLAAIEQDPLLSKLTMIAEPWDVGPGGYRLGQFPARWHEWNDHYRDDVRCFWRGDKVRSRNLGGAGLGLSIAHWIVEQHGGEIEARSDMGKGSEFTVRLQLIQESQAS